MRRGSRPGNGSFPPSPPARNPARRRSGGRPRGAPSAPTTGGRAHRGSDRWRSARRGARARAPRDRRRDPNSGPGDPSHRRRAESAALVPTRSTTASSPSAASQATTSTPSISPTPAANIPVNPLGGPALAEQVDGSRPRARTDRELGVVGLEVAGLEHSPLTRQHLGKRKRALDSGLSVVGDDDHRVLGEELVRFPRRPRQARRGRRRRGRSSRAAPRDRAGGSGSRCRAARTAGSHRGRRRSAPGRRRLSTRPGSPGAPWSACTARRGWSRAHRRRALQAPRSRGETWPRSPPAASTPRVRARDACDRDRSRTGCTRCAARRHPVARRWSPPPARGGTCSCCRRCRRASERAQRPASPRTTSRTRRSVPSTRWYQFMPLIACRSGRSPVTISEQHTGVTDGNDETQSRTSVPRSSSAAKWGASPLDAARSSMSVRSESTTQRTSLRPGRLTEASADPRTSGRRGAAVRRRPRSAAISATRANGDTSSESPARSERRQRDQRARVAPGAGAGGRPPPRSRG